MITVLFLVSIAYVVTFIGFGIAMRNASDIPYSPPATAGGNVIELDKYRPSNMR